jgi:hypothetical protein
MFAIHYSHIMLNRSYKEAKKKYSMKRVTFSAQRVVFSYSEWHNLPMAPVYLCS